MSEMQQTVAELPAKSATIPLPRLSNGGGNSLAQLGGAEVAKPIPEDASRGLTVANGEAAEPRAKSSDMDVDSHAYLQASAASQHSQSSRHGRMEGGMDIHDSDGPGPSSLRDNTAASRGVHSSTGRLQNQSSHQGLDSKGQGSKSTSGAGLRRQPTGASRGQRLLASGLATAQAELSAGGASSQPAPQSRTAGTTATGDTDADRVGDEGLDEGGVSARLSLGASHVGSKRSRGVAFAQERVDDKPAAKISCPRPGEAGMQPWHVAPYFSIADTCNALGTAVPPELDPEAPAAGPPPPFEAVTVNRTHLQRRPDGTMFIVPGALLPSLSSQDVTVVSQPGANKIVVPQSVSHVDIEAGQYLATVERDVLLIVEAAYMDVATQESTAGNTVYRCFRVGDAELQRLALGVHGPSLLPGRHSDEKYWKTANLDEKELPLQAAHPREWEGADLELHVTHAKPLGAFRDLIYKYDRPESIFIPTKKGMRWDAPRPAFVPCARYQQELKRLSKRSAESASEFATAPAPAAAPVVEKPVSKPAAAPATKPEAGSKDGNVEKIQAGECEICEKHFDNIIAHVYNHASHVEKSKTVMIMAPNRVIERVNRVAGTLSLPELMKDTSAPATSQPASEPQSEATATSAADRAASQRSRTSVTRGSDAGAKGGFTSIPYHSAQSLHRILVHAALPLAAVIPADKIEELSTRSSNAITRDTVVATGPLMSHLAGPPPALATYALCRSSTALIDEHPSIKQVHLQGKDESVQGPSTGAPLLAFDTSSLRYEWTDDVLQYANAVAGDGTNCAHEISTDTEGHVGPLLLALEKIAERHEALEAEYAATHAAATAQKQRDEAFLASDDAATENMRNASKNSGLGDDVTADNAGGEEGVPSASESASAPSAGRIGFGGRRAPEVATADYFASSEHG